MKVDVTRMTSNQWSIGICLRRSTGHGDTRWLLWINKGYNSVAWGWKKNPQYKFNKEEN